MSVEYADRLFVPFSEAEFPRQLEPLRLQQLLVRSPATLIPVSAQNLNTTRQLWTDQDHPLFTPATSDQAAGRLWARLIMALDASWPSGMPSELLYTPYWNAIGYDLPEYAGKMLEFGAVVNRYAVHFSGADANIVDLMLIAKTSNCVPHT
jgi:hypothetical protein